MFLPFSGHKSPEVRLMINFYVIRAEILTASFLINIKSASYAILSLIYSLISSNLFCFSILSNLLITSFENVSIKLVKSSVDIELFPSKRLLTSFKDN